MDPDVFGGAMTIESEVEEGAAPAGDDALCGRSACDWEISRRDLVKVAGIVAGCVALGVPAHVAAQPSNEQTGAVKGLSHSQGEHPA